MNHVLQTGFSLHTGLFLQGLSAPPSSPLHPHRALVNSVYLWGLRLSRMTSGQALADQERAFFERAAHHLQNQLHQTEEDLNKALQIIQAEVLLTTYLFACGRALEGGYHVNAAVSMATLYGMHSIMPQAAGPANPAAVDAVVEGERIRVFWRVFVLDRCWSVANSSPALIRDDDRASINTPWPLDAEQHGVVCFIVSKAVHGFTNIF